MTLNLPPDDMQKAWQQQKVDSNRFSVEEVRRDADRLNRRTRLNNWFTYAGYAVIAAIYLWIMWQPRRAAAESPAVARVSMALILAGMSYTVYQYRRKASALPRSAATELLLEDCLTFHRQQLARQRDYFQYGWWWGVAPIIPGFAVGLIGLAINVPERRRFTALSAAILVFFLYSAWKGMRSRAAGFQRKLDNLNRSSV